MHKRGGVLEQAVIVVSRQFLPLYAPANVPSPPAVASPTFSNNPSIFASHYHARK